MATRRKKPEEVVVEETPIQAGKIHSADIGDPQGIGSIEIGETTGAGTLTEGEPEYPPLTDEEYFLFKGNVLQALHELEERVRDLETQTVTPPGFELFASVEESVREIAPDEEIPMYSGVQKSFDRPGDTDEPDGEWYRPPYLR